ncbi:MAG: phosphoenolpyruvate--protein phosphotransferase [Bdellovibrionales bacterium]|nr:phosphoenolpyruvate--protein phosphotransferase [Bdellovibrionales bacterium]
MSVIKPDVVSVPRTDTGSTRDLKKTTAPLTLKGKFVGATKAAKGEIFILRDEPIYVSHSDPGADQDYEQYRTEQLKRVHEASIAIKAKLEELCDNAGSRIGTSTKQILDTSIHQAEDLPRLVENLFDRKEKSMFDPDNGRLAKGEPLFWETQGWFKETGSSICSAEFAVQTVFNAYIEKIKISINILAEMTNGLGGEDSARLDGIDKTADLEDLKQEFLKHLTGAVRPSLAEMIPKGVPVILVAKDIPPSFFAQLSPEVILEGVVLEKRAAHTKIVCKELQKPLVDNVQGLLDSLVGCSGQTGLLFGTSTDGSFVVNPTSEQLKEIIQSRQKVSPKLHATITADGQKVIIRGAASGMEGIEEAVVSGTHGIGLLRTEFLITRPNSKGGIELLEEDAQFEILSRALSNSTNFPTTIRTFDFGADKTIPEVAYEKYGVLRNSDNPLMDTRGLRLALKMENEFRTHIRAIIRAVDLHGEGRIVFPMVPNKHTLLVAKKIVEEEIMHLNREGKLKHGEKGHFLQIGAMIEDPTAAFDVRAMAPNVDFFMVGTRDFVQYTLNYDEQGSHADDILKAMNPLVLRIANFIVREAEEGFSRDDRDLKIGFCGIKVERPRSLIFLVGIGVRDIVISPKAVEVLNGLLEKIDTKRCGEVAKAAMRADNADDAQALVDAYLEEIGYDGPLD